jgi:hypothetical protein
MSKKTIQYFNPEYLSRCQGATPDQIIEFLENYRMFFAVSPEKELQKRVIKPVCHSIPEPSSRDPF